MDLQTWTYLIVWLIFALYIGIAVWSRVQTTEGFYVAGGGIHNRALMGELEARLGVPLVSSAEYGVNPDAREAEVFAFLAGACLLGVPLTQPGVTGAAEGHVLGHLVQGPTPGLTGVGS